MNGRYAGIAAMSAALMLAGCSAAPPRYAPQYAMEDKLPGAFRLVFLTGQDTGYREETRAAIQEDLELNVFDGQSGRTWDVSLRYERGKPGKYGVTCKHPDACMITLSLESASREAGEYSARRDYCLEIGFNTSNESVRVQALNQALMAMEEVKKQMNAARGNILARAGGAVPAHEPPPPPRPSATVKTNIAVATLSPEGVSQSDAAIVADWLRGALVSTGTYSVVERSAMQKVLSEQAFQQSGCTDSDCAVKLGKVLNVQRMVVGSFGKFLDSYVLNVRVVDIETGRVIYSDSANGSTTREVEGNIKALADRLSGKPAAEEAPAPKPAPAKTRF